ENTFDLIGYIAKRTGLFAISKHGKVFATQCLCNKGRQGTSVIEAHAWAVGVEDPDDTCVKSVKIMVCHGYGLLKAFGFIIHPTWANGVHVAPIFFRLWGNQRVAVYLRG